MADHQVLPHNQWVEARKTLLEKEKAFTRARDELTKDRLALPWEKVDKTYTFNGPDGQETLSDLFDGRHQLIVYHFMYGPGWEEGCKSCSFLADHFDPAIVLLNARDVSMVAVSRAPFEEFEPYRKRMGWRFKWLSSNGTDFNEDYHVSFSQDEIDGNKAYYNYKVRGFPSTEAPGASVFYKDDTGDIYHTYSVYERGLDMFIAAYHYLDIVPKGRNEEGLSFTMEWLRRHDEYDH
ncbi:MAG TPA: thioredoxin family protein [Afifellaceae bacterium]|nr:thioredoxin family protein [Afifellaceae bacterium]